MVAHLSGSSVSGCCDLPLCHTPRREAAPGWNSWNVQFHGKWCEISWYKTKRRPALFICLFSFKKKCDYIWLSVLSFYGCSVLKKKSPIWLKWVFPSDVDVGSLFWLWFFSLSFKAKQMPVEMSRSVSFGRGEADLWVWIDSSGKDFCH